MAQSLESSGVFLLGGFFFAGGWGFEGGFFFFLFFWFFFFCRGGRLRRIFFGVGRWGVLGVRGRLFGEDVSAFLGAERVSLP